MLNIKHVASAILGSSSGLLIGLAVASAGGLKDYGSPPEDTKAWVVFSGVDAAKDSYYTYQGVVVALNRDIGKDGFVLRLYGSHADYEYDTTNALAAPIKIDGDGWQGDAMLGYKVSRGHWWASAMVGIDWQSHGLTPLDVSNRVQGTEVGVKVAIDFATLRDQSPIYIAASGNYSTAFDS